MRLSRFAVFVVVSCGPREERVARPEPLPPTPAVVIDAGAPAPPPCLAPNVTGSFAEGRAFFSAKRLAEAGAVFRAIAFATPDAEDGIYASQLYLEALNQLAVGGHPACYDKMERDVPALHDLYCEARRAKNEEACDLLERIEIDMGRLHAQSLGEGAAAAAAYLALVKTWCLPATHARCDELAYDAAIEFLVAGDEAAAKRVRALMAAPSNKMDKSPLLERLDCRIDPLSHPHCH